MHLDLDGQGPLHAQLTRALKQAILGRRLRAGLRLPATRDLARQLGLSRNTVLSAYEQLSAEGFIEGRVGSGSFVAAVPGLAPAPATASTRAARARLSRYAEAATAQSPHHPPGRRRLALRYSLEYGLPLVPPSLHVAWRRALGRAANDTGFDYPPSEGLPALRAAVARYLGVRRGIAVEAEDVLIVGGTQQAIDLVGRALLDHGDRVLVEDPCYQGMRQVLSALGAKLSAVPCDDEGLRVDRLPKARARLLCVTPSHQFPSGAILSLPRRVALLDWARRSQAYVLEDDYDGEFRHDGRPLAALKSLDVDGRVFYIGSFSKVLFPALRLGYLVVPPALRETFRALKWLADRGCGAVEQQALASLIDSGQFERQLRRTGKLLGERRRALLDALRRHCARWIEPLGASSGMHLLARLTEHGHDQVAAIVDAAEARAVCVFAAAPYYVKPPARPGLLLGFSGLSPRDLHEAARRLGEALAAIAPRP